MAWLYDLLLYKSDVGGLLWPEFALWALIFLVGFSILISIVKTYLQYSKPKGVEDAIDTIFRVCANCQWRGELSRHSKRCPRCGQNNFVE